MRRTIRNRISMTFCFVYPILPVYASVMGVNGRNLLCFLTLILTLIFSRELAKVRMQGLYGIDFIFAVWISGRFFQILFSKSFLEAVYFLLLTVLMYYCMSRLVKGTVDFLACIKAILCGGCFVSVLGFFEEITKINLFSYTNRSYELNYNPPRFGILRILGFSQHTIVHGVYIMFCMSLCMYIWQFVKHKSKERSFIIILYILLGINLILTLSRSIIIRAIVFEFFILCLSGVRKFFKVIFKLLVIGIPFVAATSLFVPRVLNILKAGVLMIAALFDDKAAAMISGVFGNDNIKGVGNRIDLYKWVIDEMPGYWIFGHGWNAKFSHPYIQSNGIYTWIQIKDSIEVQYLSTLYQYGLFGMVTEILTFISLIATCLKRRMRKREWEPVISFNKVAFATLLCYFLEMFAVNQSSDRYIFYLFVILVLLYNTNGLMHATFKTEDYQYN